MPVDKKSETAASGKTRTVSSALDSGFEDQLIELLEKAVQEDGAIRVFAPKKTLASGKTPGLSLFSRSKSPFFPGDWFVETLPRPQMVKVNRPGIHFLLMNTHPNQRQALVARASDYYKPMLLEIWKKIARPNEATALQSSIQEHLGDWLKSNADAGIEPKLDAFKHSLAEELALSWSEASSEEARKRLSYFLLLVGAQTLEQTGSLVTFAGIKHKSKSALFKGDNARVLNPGWVWPGADDTPQYLVKAEVTAAE
jgi:hypothetical protein